MAAEIAAVLALGVYVAGLVTAFGVRSWIHYRRTGTHGFRGVTGAPGSAEWWGGVLFAAALVLGAAGPVLSLTGTITAGSLPAGLTWAGLAIALAGFTGVLASQAAMGASWRIGVDDAERTDLVTTGVFALVRNPVFTAMLIALGGLVLLVPTMVSGAALVCLLIAVEIQVRRVEEPYLLATHGQAYVTYAATVGRFVPGLGRLSTMKKETTR